MHCYINQCLGSTKNFIYKIKKKKMSKKVHINIQASTDFDFNFEFPSINGTNEYTISKSDDTTIINIEFEVEHNSKDLIIEFLKNTKIEGGSKNGSKEMWKKMSKKYIKELENWSMTYPHSTDYQIMSGNWGFFITVNLIEKHFIIHPNPKS